MTYLHGTDAATCVMEIFRLPTHRIRIEYSSRWLPSPLRSAKVGKEVWYDAEGPGVVPEVGNGPPYISISGASGLSPLTYLGNPWSRSFGQARTNQHSFMDHFGCWLCS
jgi:hypothetical protein